MKIIISPAKKMNTDGDGIFGFDDFSTPVFINEAEKVLGTMKQMTYAELKSLWKCNDSIAELNFDRITHGNLSKAITPAIFAYDGIQYKNLSPNTLETEALEYLKKHLRILSGMYGVLSPFDAVIPYRLEMQAKLGIDGKIDLYDFWGSKIADNLFEKDDIVINLASKEYSKVVTDHLPEGKRIITCAFTENINGKLVEKGTLCKMARGACVRFMAENNIKNTEDIKNFNSLGYKLSEENSDENTFTFIKE